MTTLSVSEAKMKLSALAVFWSAPTNLLAGAKPSTSVVTQILCKRLKKG